MVSEFGQPETPLPTDSLLEIHFDIPRSEYYLSYVTEILNAIWEDGIDVLGVLAWNWVDN